jgi:hypothetical protein
MIIGIISDTHDRLEPTRRAIAKLRAAGAEVFIHCGDVGGEAVFDLMAGLPFHFVWGNTDYDRTSLADYAQHLGLQGHNELADLELGGKKIAVTHGDNSLILRQIAAAKKHDYLFHGHTHMARDDTVGGMRLINPGAIHRTSHPSVAVLDTATGVLKFIHLPREKSSGH